MKKLVRVESPVFSEYYEGCNGQRKVCCILDLNCIRYMVLEPGKWGLRQVARREYRNGNEALCFANAEKALNM